jgi:serine protease Do
MKKIVFASCLAAATLLSTGSIAQEKKEKEKIGEYDEVIIRKKGDKGGKVTVEIKDGNVTVNGKPIDEYDDDNISVRTRKALRTVNGTGTSRFRVAPSQRAWNYADDGGPTIVYSNSNKAFLGVSSDEEGDDDGAVIMSVTENSAADKAGLKKGDVITKVDEYNVGKPSDLTMAIGKFKPEDKVTITYKRDGKVNKATATLGKNKSTTSVRSYGLTAPRVYTPSIEPFNDFNFDWDDNGHNFGVFGRPRLGIRAQDTEEGKGVKVLDVMNESLAAKSGIKEGDIITEFDGQAINSAEELAEAAQESREKTSVKVSVIRDGKSQTIEIKTPKKLKTANL